MEKLNISKKTNLYNKIKKINILNISLLEIQYSEIFKNQYSNSKNGQSWNMSQSPEEFDDESKWMKRLISVKFSKVKQPRQTQMHQDNLKVFEM